jgi:DNA-binding MarR family transcriptional regulator
MMLDDVATGLNSAAIHLVRRLRRADESLGVTPARLSALSVLVFGGPRSISALAEAEQVTGPTMSRIVAALVDAGLVERDPDPDDARAVVLTATPTGRSLMERGRRQRVDRLVRDLEGLDESEVATLREAVAILRHLERAPAPPTR